MYTVSWPEFGFFSPKKELLNFFRELFAKESREIAARVHDY